jgi:putative sigma-54 modulation protein
LDVSVSSRNVDLSESLRAAAIEKIGRLDRFLDGMERAEVHFFEERNPRIAEKVVCEVTMEGHGHHVRAKVAAADTYASVDAAVAKLEHQLHKLKTKLVARSHPRRRDPAALANSAAGATATAGPGSTAGSGDGVVEEGPYRIVRTKRFVTRPMSPDEAALQMDLLGHDFYFFANADTGQAAVVYRRRAGDVGLIDSAD